MGMDLKTVGRLLDLIKAPITLARTGSRVSCRQYADGSFAKIILFGEGNTLAKKLGLERMVTTFMSNGERELVADFSVKSSLLGGWGGRRTLVGNTEQMRATFEYLNGTVNENCNTIAALEKLDSIRCVTGNGFANYA